MLWVWRVVGARAELDGRRQAGVWRGDGGMGGGNVYALRQFQILPSGVITIIRYIGVGWTVGSGLLPLQGGGWGQRGGGAAGGRLCQQLPLELEIVGGVLEAAVGGRWGIERRPDHQAPRSRGLWRGHRF